MDAPLTHPAFQPGRAVPLVSERIKMSGATHASLVPTAKGRKFQADSERRSGGWVVRESHSILMRIAFDSFENWKVGEGVRGVERAGRCDRRCFSGWWLTRCMTKRPSPPFGH